MTDKSQSGEPANPECRDLEELPGGFSLPTGLTCVKGGHKRLTPGSAKVDRIYAGQGFVCSAAKIDQQERIWVRLDEDIAFGTVHAPLWVAWTKADVRQTLKFVGKGADQRTRSGFIEVGEASDFSAQSINIEAVTTDHSRLWSFPLGQGYSIKHLKKRINIRIEAWLLGGEVEVAGDRGQDDGWLRVSLTGPCKPGERSGWIRFKAKTWSGDAGSNDPMLSSDSIKDVNPVDSELSKPFALIVTTLMPFGSVVG